MDLSRSLRQGYYWLCIFPWRSGEVWRVVKPWRGSFHKVVAGGGVASPPHTHGAQCEESHRPGDAERTNKGNVLWSVCLFPRHSL